MHMTQYRHDDGMRPSLLIPLLLLAAALPLRAQVRTLDLREMAGSAGMIFTGSVMELEGRNDEHGNICTFTTFLVEQPITPIQGPVVAVKQYGGDDGRRSARLAHARYFQKGERVLVMLYPVSELGYTSPVGLSQGVWEVSPEGMVIGIDTRILVGLEPLLKKYKVSTVERTVSIPLDTFAAMIWEIREGGKQ